MTGILHGGITLESRNSVALTDASRGGVYDNLVINNFSAGNEFGVGIFASLPGTASYNNRVIHNELALNVEAGVEVHALSGSQNVSGNAIVNNTIFANGIDPISGSTQPTGIALFSAVVPMSVAVTDNHISSEFWGIFTAGPITIRAVMQGDLRSFDPIWTADTGGHFFHRVGEPWGHLVRSDEEYIALMAGAEAWEIDEFRHAMNRRRLVEHRRNFEEAADRGEITILHQDAWKGVVKPDHCQHTNWRTCLAMGFSEEELLTRGLRYLFQRR